jgi:hypothetical protein
MAGFVTVVDATPDETLQGESYKHHTLAIIQAATLSKVEVFLETANKYHFKLQQYKNVRQRRKEIYLKKFISWLFEELPTSEVSIHAITLREEIILASEKDFLQLLDASVGLLVRGQWPTIEYIGHGYLHETVKENGKDKIYTIVHTEVTSEEGVQKATRVQRLPRNNALMILWKAFELRKIYHAIKNAHVAKVAEREIRFTVLADRLPADNSGRGLGLLSTFLELGIKGWCTVKYIEGQKNLPIQHLVDNIAALFQYYVNNPNTDIALSISNLLTSKSTKDHFSYCINNLTV